MNSELLHLPEPRLLFNFDQATEDPRDGLTLFGPLDRGKPFGIRYGIVGTRDGVRRFRAWVTKCQHPITAPTIDPARPTFPGFEAAFGIPWNPTPSHEVVVDETEVHRRIHFDDRHVRVFQAVDLYASAILSNISGEDSPVDLWFVVLPDEVQHLPASIHSWCRRTHCCDTHAE